ncbi:hypothetical protein C8R44DRAFT_975738 [Mycena epipterygia]|nr:hypothetical protein C8R44DRAFT_975738 [Mycena epipterygia]
MPSPLTNLAGTVLESFLYGIYLNLFVTSTYILVKRSKGAHAPPLYRSTMFILSWALFLLVTANWILAVNKVFIGFIFFQGGSAAPAYFNDSRQVITEGVWVTTIISIIINDSMIIFRLWVVWGRNKLVIVVPILSLIGVTVSTTLVVVTSWGVQSSAQVIGFLPSFVCTLVTNIYCTGFIIWRIWTITKACTAVNGSNLNGLLAMLIESSALYTSWVLFYTVTEQITSDVQYVAFGAIPAVAGIANALIQARIGLGKTIEPSTKVPTTAPLRFPTRNSSACEASRNDIEMRGDVGRNQGEVKFYGAIAG